MKAIKMTDGNLEFALVEGIEEFEQRIKNSLNIFSVETYWDITKGISFDVISSKDGNYKLQHIKKKLFEWYGEELLKLEYEKITKTGSLVTAVLKYVHKKYKEQEVSIVV